MLIVKAQSTYSFILSLFIIIVAQVTIIKIVSFADDCTQTECLACDENESSETEDETTLEEAAIPQPLTKLTIIINFPTGTKELWAYQELYSFLFKEKILNPPKF